MRQIRDFQQIPFLTHSAPAKRRANSTQHLALSTLTLRLRHQIQLSQQIHCRRIRHHIQ